VNLKVELFRQIFRGRQDIVPRHWISKDGKRQGYTPLCKNEWKDEVCQKPCRNCQNADYVPLSDSLILSHFKGNHIYSDLNQAKVTMSISSSSRLLLHGKPGLWFLHFCKRPV
jgi:hypothetical protein